jgi:hypothetical protein
MLPPNPQYGSGIFRRRVRIMVAARQVNVDLEDSNHAFRLVLRHDGERITAIEPEAVRHPFTTCPDASGYLQALVGQPLDAPPDVRRMFETRVSCTHLTDMTVLALAHVRDDGLVRVFDIAVDDERDGRQRARISCDGGKVHDWTVAQHAILEPAALAGRTMIQGFHAWARQAFAGMPLEAATALQRGYFVAQARRYLTVPEREYPAIGDGLPEGVCYSYSSPAVQRALRIEGSKRDFTGDPGALLRFERPGRP